MYELITYEKKDGAALLIFDRPQVHNAISRAMRAEIVDALADAAADETVGVLVLAANGKSFCAGRDMKEVGGNAGKPMAQVFEDYTLGKEFLDHFQSFGKPLIAAVNGYALGYGTSIISYCDLVAAEESAVFGFPEIRNNIVPSTASVKTCELVTPRKMAEMVLLGNRYTAAQAAEMGLVNCVVPDGSARDTALEWAAQLAGNDVMTNMLCKQYLQSLARPGYEARAIGTIGVLGMGYINKNNR